MQKEKDYFYRGNKKKNELNLFLRSSALQSSSLEGTPIVSPCSTSEKYKQIYF